MTSTEGPGALLDLIEHYYDAVPRREARAEDHGPLTLFVREGEGWPFYARPASGWSDPVRADDVARVRDRQRELGIPESFEWVAETTPALRAAIEGAGLAVHEHPLMVLGTDAATVAPEGAPGYPAVRVLGADDPALPSALVVPHLAFAEPGTRVARRARRTWRRRSWPAPMTARWNAAPHGFGRD